MSYTTHSAKQRTGLYRRFSGCLPRFVATVWRVYPAILHRLRHVRAHTRAQMHYTDTRYQRHAGRCTAQHSRPIIIRYIRVRPCYGFMPARRGQLLPSVDCWQVLAACQQYRPGAPAEGSASPPVQGQPGGVSILPKPDGLQSGTGSAVRAHPPPGGTVQQQGRGGRRGTIDGYRRISFRAFAR